MAVEPNAGSPTRAQMRGMLRSMLPDRAAVADYWINQWISDGLREYSAAFPYRTWGTLACEAGVQRYLLNDRLSLNSIIHVTGVEYPCGRAPRRFLTRLDEHDPAFAGGPFYDIGAQNTHVEYTFGTPELVYLALGELPQAGQQVWVEYETVHPVPQNDQEVITLPEHHLDVLRLYVLWRAAEQIEAQEAVSVDRKDAGDLSLRTLRCEQAYRARLQSLLAAASAPAALVRWRMAGGRLPDRVY